MSAHTARGGALPPEFEDSGFTIAPDNLFEDGHTPDDAEVLYFRNHTLGQFEVLIRYHGWTQKEAAERFGVPQPRISELLHRKRDNFSIETIMRMAARVGIKVRLQLPEGMPDCLPDGWPQGAVPVDAAAKKPAGKTARKTLRRKAAVPA